MQSAIAEQVTKLVEPLLDEIGIELVEVQFQGNILRVTIFKEGGVGIDDCAKVSREVAHLLEVEDLIEHKYHLEVSSPGLDRPLRNQRDFNRNINQELKATLNEPPGQQVTGTIVRADGDSIVLDTGKEQISIPLTRIAKAKLIF